MTPPLTFVMGAAQRAAFIPYHAVRLGYLATHGPEDMWLGEVLRLSRLSVAEELGERGFDVTRSWQVEDMPEFRGIVYSQELLSAPGSGSSEEAPCLPR